MSDQEKRAFLGALGRMGFGAARAAAPSAAPALRNTMGNLAGSVARGVFGVGSKAGATRTMKAVNGVTQAGMIGAPLMASAFANQPAPGERTASYNEGAVAALSKFAQGLNFEALKPHVDHLLELGGLGVLAGAPLYHMAAPKEFQEKHPHVGEALDLAGLGILAVPAIRGLRSGH